MLPDVCVVGRGKLHASSELAYMCFTGQCIKGRSCPTLVLRQDALSGTRAWCGAHTATTAKTRNHMFYLTLRFASGVSHHRH